MQKINSCLIIISMVTLIRATEFLGTFGATYNISEKDGIEQIEETMKNSNYEEMLKKETENSIKKALNPKDMLPLCIKNETRQIEFMKKLEQEAKERNIDLNNPANKQKLDLIFNTMNINYYILDANDERQVIYAQKQNFKNLILSNGYVYDERLKEFADHSYVLSDAMIKDFQLKCTPTHIYFDTKSRKLLIDEIDISTKTKKGNE